uniref:Uncharacterized protein n=1 Tax=Arundo donax TaxID=35708 RepID=A0A0A9C3G4_ARUDO
MCLLPLLGVAVEASVAS